MMQRSVAIAETESPREAPTASALDRRRRTAITEAQPASDAALVDRFAKLRASVLEEARGWLRTPYHHMGRVRGGGTDCLMLLAECMRGQA
jgi:cell wall-associated NlpC family hydrolase